VLDLFAVVDFRVLAPSCGTQARIENRFRMGCAIGCPYLCRKLLLREALSSGTEPEWLLSSILSKFQLTFQRVVVVIYDVTTGDELDGPVNL